MADTIYVRPFAEVSPDACIGVAHIYGARCKHANMLILAKAVISVEFLPEMSPENLAIDKLDEFQEARDGVRYAQLSILRKNDDYSHRSR